MNARRTPLLFLVLALSAAGAGAQTFERLLDRPSGVSGSHYAHDVAVSGEHVVVGMPYGSTTAGQGLAFIYAGESGDLLHTLTPPVPDPHFFGRDVAISDGRVAVTSYASNDGVGWAGVYDAATGQLLETLAPENPMPAFGYSVAIDGDRVAVNSVGNFDQPSPGIVTVFDLASNGKVTIPAPAGIEELKFFGETLALDDRTLVAGTPRQTRVDVFDAATGFRFFTLTGPTSGSTSLFGRAVAVDGDRIAVGDERRGRAYLYDRDTGDLVATLSAETPTENDMFGRALALQDGLLVVGAPYYDAAGPEAGRLYGFDAQDGTLLFTLEHTDTAAAPAPTLSTSVDGGPHGPPAGGAATGGGSPGEQFGNAVALDAGRLVVGSLWDGDSTTEIDVGRARIYRVHKPRWRVLSVGVDDGSVLSPVRGDLAAELVAETLSEGLALSEDDVELVSLSWADGAGNKQLLQERLEDWKERVGPDDTFVLYLATHGSFAEEGDEVPVCAQDRLDLPQAADEVICRESTGDELLLLGQDGTRLCDDELRAWLDDPVWDEVNKLVVLDACMSGGFWGTTVRGDTGDLATLPRCALVASAPEWRFSYADPFTGMPYLATALAVAWEALAAQIEGLAEGDEPPGFEDLARLVRDEAADLADLAVPNAQLQGVAQCGDAVDLSSSYHVLAPADVPVFAVSTADFALVPGSDPMAEPDVIRVPQDVSSLQEAIYMASIGDTIRVRGGPYVGPVVLEGKHGLTIRARAGTQIVGAGLSIVDCTNVEVRGFRIPHVQGPAVAIAGSTGIRVEKLRVVGGDGPGVEVTSSSLVTLSKVKVEDTAGDGIVLGRMEAGLATASEVMRCRVLRAGGDGITVAGHGNTVSRCRVQDSAGIGVGVPLAGSQNVLERNRVLDAGADGMIAAGADQLVCRNRVMRAGGHGLVLTGAGAHVVERNRSVQPGADGVRVEAPGNRLDRNRVTGAAAFGFRFTGGGTGNEVTRNRAFGSGLGALQDAVGGNTYDGNSFDLEAP